MQAEWLYEAGPAAAGAEAEAVGLSMLRSLAVLVRSSPSMVVREEALTAVGCIASVSEMGRAGVEWGGGRRAGVS